MSIDKEKLKALAEKCIERGPRTVSEGKGSENTSVLNINVDSRLVTVCQVIGSSNPMVNWYPGVARFRDEANFIGACDPDTILALLEDIDQLKTENETLRKDAERYRWLMSKAVHNGTLGIADGWIDFEFKEEAQQAIDAAMAKEAAT